MAKHKSGADDKSIAVQLVLTARAFRTRSAELLATIGLFPGQEQVLQVLFNHEINNSADQNAGSNANSGIPMGDLAIELSVRAPTVSKTIARLTTQGLVERQGTGMDRRQVRVALTEAGRERAARIEDITEKLDDELIEGLDAKDRKRFRKLLRKAARNIIGTGTQDHTEDMDDTDE